MRGRHESPTLQLKHVLIPSPSPTAHGNKSADRMLARNQGRESTAIAEPQHKNAIQIDEAVFRKGIEGSLPAFQFALKIGLFAIPSAFADPGLVHANRGVARLINQTQHESGETV